MLNRRGLGAVVFLALLPTLSACGGNSAASASHGAGPVSSKGVSTPFNAGSVPTTRPTPTAPPAPAPQRTWNVTGRARDGSTETGDVKVWPAEKASEFVLWAAWPANQCTPDPERDAVVPFELHAISTTSGFRTNPNISLSLLAGDSLPQVSLSNTLGAACDAASDGSNPPHVGVRSTSSLAFGGDVDTMGYIILSNFYTPANPGGTPAALKLPLSVDSGTVDGTNYALRGAGPGVCNDGDLGTVEIDYDGSKAAPTPYETCT